MHIKVYSTVQINEWACPGALYAIDENGYIVWIQQNPDNDMTRTYFDDDRSQFDITGFKSVVLVDEYDE